MTKHEIRKTKAELADLISRANISGHTDALIQAHQGMMLIEIAAQLAELNEHLSSVIGGKGYAAEKCLDMRVR
jgi:hypothetical protein